MPEKKYSDEIFPLQGHFHPPKVVQWTQQYFQSRLARAVSARPAMPLIIAGDAWARHLTATGERFLYIHPWDDLYFLKMGSHPESFPAGLSHAVMPKTPPLPTGSQTVRRKSHPWQEEVRRAKPTEAGRLSGSIQRTTRAGAPTWSPNSGVTAWFPTTVRTSGWGMIRPVPSTQTTETSGRAPSAFRRLESLQAGEAFLLHPPGKHAGVQESVPFVDGAFPAPPGRPFIRPMPTLTLKTDTGMHRWRPPGKRHDGIADGMAGFTVSAGPHYLIQNRGPGDLEANHGFSAPPPGAGFLLSTAKPPPGRFNAPTEARHTFQAQVDTSAAPFGARLAEHALGCPLGVVTRVILERAFPDLKLSQVRIHADDCADGAVRQLGADAFVLGTDLFFRSGAFNPLTERGLALLTHELVHIRQTEGVPTPIAPSRRDRLEREARDIEGLLLHPNTHPQTGRPPRPDAPVRSGIANFSPLPMILSRPAAATPLADRNMGRQSRHATLMPLDRVPAQRPLMAETSRTVPAPGPSAGDGDASTEPDQESLSRQIFRALERSILIEKERRGIDRWEP